jgi:hypothetical protein
MIFQMDVFHPPIAKKPPYRLLEAEIIYCFVHHVLVDPYVSQRDAGC